MLRNHTGFRKWQLRGDQGIAPSWTASGQVSFNLDSIPIMTDGDKANYLAGIEVTFIGALDLSVAYAGFLCPETIITQGLLSSALLQGAWHGKPVDAETVRGATLGIMEFVSCGYRWASRKRPAFDLTALTAKNFRHTVFIPLSFLLGRKPHHTMQLAALYKDAQLTLNLGTGPDTFLFGGAVGAFTGPGGVGSPTIRATAVLLAERELRLGPGSEWMEYRAAGPSAGASTEEVRLDSFGNKTGLQGVEPGAGISFCGLLSGSDTSPAWNQEGSLDERSGTAITQLEVPFRGQTQTQHIDPFFTEAEEAVGIGSRGQNIMASDALTVFVSDKDGHPWYDDWARRNDFGALTHYRFLPLITPFPDLEASKLQVVEGTQSYYVAATWNGNAHRTLAHQFKSWSPAAMEDARRLIIDSGMALKILGTNNVAWSTKTLNKNADTMDVRKARFFAQRLLPA